jgi:glycerol-3-phosphate dehydrogenase (NAD(P)+)
MSADPIRRVGVIGAGSWGTALAALLADKGYHVTLWAWEKVAVEEMNVEHENALYLPGIRLPENLRGTRSLQEACQGQDMLVWVTPSHVARTVLTQARPFLPVAVPIVIATKGIENESLMLMSEVFEDVLPIDYHPWLAYLSGPSFAREVAQRMPTAVVVASLSDRLGQRVQQAFHHSYFRVYRSPDVIGVEIGGSLKNVIAIAAGISDGMGFGHNAMAGMLTRGLAEMSRLAVAKGANPLTLAGLSGMGDLVLTCTGGLSRNRQVGIRLGKGETIHRILGDMNMVAEGVKTALSVNDLRRQLHLDMPICEGVYQVLYEGKAPAQALQDLLGRELKRENFGF